MKQYFIGQISHGHYEGYWSIWKQPKDLRVRAIRVGGVFSSADAAQIQCYDLNAMEGGDDE